MRVIVFILIIWKMVVSFNGLIDYIEDQKNQRMDLIQAIEQQY